MKMKIVVAIFLFLSSTIISAAKPQSEKNEKGMGENITTDKYKLIYFNHGGLAEPIRLIFALADIPYEDVRIDKLLDLPLIKEKLPWGQVPILEVNGKVLAQTNAIGRFLARKYNLTGSDDFEAAKCDEYVDTVVDLRENSGFLFKTENELKKTIVKTELLEVEFHRKFEKFVAILDASDGKFLLGTKVTWADLVFAHYLEFFDQTLKHNILKDYPALQKFKDAVYNIPNIKNWISKRPKTNF